MGMKAREGIKKQASWEASPSFRKANKMKKIYLVIVDETDAAPYIHNKPFDSREKAKDFALSLGKKYIEENGEYFPDLVFDEDEMTIYNADYPMVNYLVDWVELK